MYYDLIQINHKKKEKDVQREKYSKCSEEKKKIMCLN